MMKRLSPILLLLGMPCLVVIPHTGAWAEDCEWLPTSTVDRAFPGHAPWRVTVGGAVGRCQFMSRPDQPPSMFGVNQMVHDSPQAAAEFVRGLRPEMAKSYEIVDAPALGEGGFYYLPLKEAGGRAMVGYAGHRDRVTAMATLSLFGAMSPELREAGVELVQAALAMADDERAMARASDCPWLDATLLEPVLPAGGIKQHVLGENSCLATDAANAALTVTAREASPALLQRREDSCTWEDVPALGADAALGHSCTGGRPRITLRLRVGDTLLEYVLAAGEEPTSAQREALLDLGSWVHQRHRG